VKLGLALCSALAIAAVAAPVRAQDQPAQQPASPQQPVDYTNAQPGLSGSVAPPRILPDEEVPRGQTVADRPRPDYDPPGLRLGSFILYPDLDVTGSFNSNILGQASHPLSDYIVAIQPAVDLKSDWNNNALNFHADGTINKYTEHSDQDYDDYTFSSDGRIDIDRSAILFGGVGYSVRHQPVYSPNNLGSVIPGLQSAVPEQYSDLSARGGGRKTFNRLSFRFDVAYDQYSFNDVASTSGVSVPFHLQNYNEEQFILRSAYELFPQSEVYVLTRYDIRNHDFSSDLFGFNRNSTGYTVAAGAKYDLTGVTFIDAYAGYYRQDYRDARLQPLDGPTFAVKLTWNVTRLTTVTGSLNRSVAETDLPGVSGYVATVGETHVDHELLRNVILRASLGWEEDSFQGIARTDDYYAAGVGAKYLINRNFALSVDYSFQVRNSSQSVNNFRANIVGLRLSSHF